MTTPHNVTLIEGAIHNPSEPRHFMTIVAATTRRVATVNGQVVADSADAVIVKEVGREIYDPVVYFPRADVAMSSLRSIDTTTHCPLKGDTEYFDIATHDHADYPEAAWSYVEIVVGNELRDLIAFDPAQVSVTETVGGQR